MIARGLFLGVSLGFWCDLFGYYSCWSFLDKVRFAMKAPMTVMITIDDARLNTSSALPPSLVNAPVLGTTIFSSSSSSSSDFGSTILKLALALPESGSVKYASKECSPNARVLRRLAGRMMVWLSGSTVQSILISWYSSSMMRLPVPQNVVTSLSILKANDSSLPMTCSAPSPSSTS